MNEFDNITFHNVLFAIDVKDVKQITLAVDAEMKHSKGGKKCQRVDKTANHPLRQDIAIDAVESFMQG